MNRTLLSFFLAIYSATAFSDTDVVFDGVLISEPCNISSSSEEQIVDFKNIPSKTFISHNRTVPEKFSFLLTECDLSLGQTVTVSFQGRESDLASGNFATDGDAKGISIALEDIQGNPVVPNQPATALLLNEGDTLLEYNAYIQADDYSRVDFGDFTSSVTFSFEYE
jgi:type 1 fimbria pilin